MKKLLVACSLAALVLTPVAVASDGAALYKSCAGCHGVDGAKPTGGSTPVKGQTSDALLAKLKGYADGSFGGKQKGMMVNIVKKHSEDDLKNLADHMSKF